MLPEPEREGELRSSRNRSSRIAGACLPIRWSPAVNPIRRQRAGEKREEKLKDAG